MCRWLAYIGDPVNVGEALFEPQNSLIHQALDSRLGAEPTNGDGFGLGWYAPEISVPARYRTVTPAWHDRNLQELTRVVRSDCFLAHVRAAIGSPVQETNCHPFRHGRWMFVHNGYVDGWDHVHRELSLQVDPDLYNEIEGSTDSEVLFLLAVTFGLDHDPSGAIERMVGVVEEACARAGARQGIQMTVAATNGEALHVVRHATRGQARSLYRSENVGTLKALYPDHPLLHKLADDAHMVVSEPLGDLPGAWLEIPQGTALTVTRDGVDSAPFQPRAATAPAG
jgi:glutamine amidotransferase